MKIEIVESNISNWREFKNIRLESLMCEPEAFSSSLKKTDAFPDKYWIDMVSDRNNIILLAFVDSVCVGIIRAAIKDEDVKEGTAFIGSFFVNANYRRQGIGKALMNELLARINTHLEISTAKLWVSIKQSDAIKFYDNNGFKYVGEDLKEGNLELVFEKVIR